MMKPKFLKRALWAMLGALLPLCVPAQSRPPLPPPTGAGQADSLCRVYDEEHPLVYTDAWNLWPYCYQNDHGEPEGFNVDLVRMICEELDIPYVIQLKNTREAIEDLKTGKSDLMLGLDNRYNRNDFKSSKSVVQLFTHSVVYPKTLAQHVRVLDDLGRQRVIVHKNSFCHHLMEDHHWDGNAIPLNDMKAAIKKVSSEEKGQIVWNSMCLKWLMRKFQIDNLEIEPVEMPNGAYKFMSRDTMLLSRFDDVYKRLSMSTGNFEKLQKQWFYPEQQDTGIPSWIWYVIGAVGGVALLLLLSYLFYRYRAQKMKRRIVSSINLLTHLLEMNDMNIWIFDIANRTYHWLGTKGHVEHSFSSLEFSHRYSHTEYERLLEALKQIAAMKKQQNNLTMRAMKQPEGKGEECELDVVLSVLRREKGKPTVILGTENDVTEQNKRSRRSEELLLRYKSIFETAMVDMIYYNSEGYITNLNKRAMHTFGMDREKAQKLHINLKDVVDDIHFNLNDFSYYHVTRSMDVYNKFLPEEEQQSSKIYYELQFVPVRDKDHHLLGVFGTGIDVTEMVVNWRRQKENNHQLKQASLELKDYIKNLDYVMKVGGVRIANYSPQTHTLTIYRETNVVQYTLTQTRCMSLVADSSKKLALRLLNSMDNLSPASIDTEIQTALRLGGRTLQLQVSFIPTYDTTGKVNGYFGMCRDISDIKSTEEQLEKETKRAQDVEGLKNSFLRNMSYEIRTPLNTVVGFSELFEMDHQQEDEDIFIREIKENAAHLLRLINDILFLSRLDAHMIEINKQPIDFAKTFESHCVNGWATEQKPDVRYIVVNHFEQLVVNIDDANLGLIIRQLTTNATQHTESGTVRARYDYIDGKLMIAIEDTGEGISEEAMKHIFDRFNSAGHNGTGLGLPICREMAKQMGGHLEIDSRVGNGTTVWIVIPCEALQIERKMED